MVTWLNHIIKESNYSLQTYRSFTCFSNILLAIVNWNSIVVFINVIFINTVILGEKRETGEYSEVSDVAGSVNDDHQHDEPRQAPTYEQLRLEGHNSNMYDSCLPTSISPLV